MMEWHDTRFPKFSNRFILQQNRWYTFNAWGIDCLNESDTLVSQVLILENKSSKFVLRKRIYVTIVQLTFLDTYGSIEKATFVCEKFQRNMEWEANDHYR